MAAPDAETHADLKDADDLLAATEVLPLDGAGDDPAGGAASGAAKDPKKAKAKKPPKGKKAAKGVAEDAPAAGGGRPTIAGHPRASRAVVRARAWGGLAGFLLGGYLSLPTHTLADAGLRALLAGVVSYVAVWTAAVFLWRRLVVLELKARQQQLVSPPAQGRALPGPGGARGGRAP